VLPATRQKLEVSTAFLFREYRKHRTFGRTDRLAGCKLNVAPLGGSHITMPLYIHTHLRQTVTDLRNSFAAELDGNTQ